MKTTPNEFLIRNLEGIWPRESLYYMPKEEALKELKSLTGEDFGYDTNAWRKWFKVNPIPEQKDENSEF